MSKESENARGGFSLDKDARLTGKRTKEAEENRPKPLDPPFPYRIVAFDPSFWEGLPVRDLSLVLRL